MSWLKLPGILVDAGDSEFIQEVFFSEHSWLDNLDTHKTADDLRVVSEPQHYTNCLRED